MNINPFRLLSSSYDPGALYKQPQIDQGVVVSADSGVESNSAPIQKSKNLRSVETASKPLPSYFASRYEDEIASTSKISEYKSLGEKYKSILLKEAKELQIRFSKDLQVANKMESTVNSISTMLTEFVEIIQVCEVAFRLFATIAIILSHASILIGRRELLFLPTAMREGPKGGS